MKVKVVRTARGLPWLSFEDRASYKRSKTDQYDAGAGLGGRVGAWVGGWVGECQAASTCSRSWPPCQLARALWCRAAGLQGTPVCAFLAPHWCTLTINCTALHCTAEAMRYLSYALYPLVAGYSIYALYFQTHKSWYRWVGAGVLGAMVRQRRGTGPGLRRSAEALKSCVWGGRRGCCGPPGRPLAQTPRPCMAALPLRHAAAGC